VFKEPIVDDKVLKESLAAHEKFAESMLRVSERTMQTAAAMSMENNMSPVSQGTDSPGVFPSGGQQGDVDTAGTNASTKKLSTKRQCGYCGTYYDIRSLGCPTCKAPKFGLDATSKCNKCGFTHLTGGRCPSRD
jgi:hypothetical protein